MQGAAEKGLIAVDIGLGFRYVARKRRERILQISDVDHAAGGRRSGQAIEFAGDFVPARIQAEKPVGVLCAAPGLSQDLRRKPVGEHAPRQPMRPAALGWTPYHVASLSGPGLLTALMLQPGSGNRDIRQDFAGRIQVIREEVAPIVRGRNRTYGGPGLHWSERQKSERLFLT